MADEPGLIPKPQPASVEVDPVQTALRKWFPARITRVSDDQDTPAREDLDQA